MKQNKVTIFMSFFVDTFFERMDEPRIVDLPIASVQDTYGWGKLEAPSIGRKDPNLDEVVIDHDFEFSFDDGDSFSSTWSEASSEERHSTSPSHIPVDSYLVEYYDRRQDGKYNVTRVRVQAFSNGDQVEMDETRELLVRSPAPITKNP